MKKLLAMLLALLLCSLAVVPAFAEDVSESDLTVTLPDAGDFKFERRDTEKFATGTSDVVSISGNRYTIDTGRFHYVLDLDPTMGFLCLTQDYVASLENYWAYNDSEGMWQIILDNGIHILLDNLYYSSVIYFMEDDGDLFSSKIVNLSDWSAELQSAYMDIFMTAYGFTSGEIIQCGSTSWMRLEDWFYVTIINSNYVFAKCEGENAMTYEDGQDIADILSSLTITAR